MSITYSLNGQTYSASGTAANPQGVAPPGATNIVYGTPAQPSSPAPAANTSLTMTKDSLAPVTPITLPTAPTAPNYNGAVVGGNAGLGITAPTKDANGNLITTPTAPVTPTAPASTLDQTLKAGKDLFDSYINGNTPPPNLADEYKQEQQDAGIQQKQQLVNSLTSQINTITATAAADKLSLTGQGRGVPETIIGGQQAEIDKEAAIKVLPIQASLAAAQGDLTLAQDRVDTLFKLRSQDLTTTYNYNQSLRTAVYNFADKQQQTKIDALNKVDDRKFTITQANLAKINEWSKEVITTGQPGLIAKFAKLDPTSPTFEKDFAAVQSQIVNKKATTPGTLAERQAAAISQFSSAFVQGAKMKDGTSVLDTNGFATPQAWKAAISDAPKEGLTREEFIKQFGYLLYGENGSISPAYGLTPAEQKIINGALPAAQ